MDPTVAVAIAGVAGTLVGAIAGPMLQAWQTARHARDIRLYDLRINLYSRAAKYLEILAFEAREPDGLGRDFTTDAEAVELTADMRLLAPDNVSRAWARLVDQARSPAFGYGHSNAPAAIQWHAADLVKATDPVRTAMRQATGADR